MEIGQTQPYFDTMDTALRQLLQWFTDDHQPEVYKEVDASNTATYIQWNMDNSSWYSVFESLLEHENVGDGGNIISFEQYFPKLMFDE